VVEFAGLGGLFDRVMFGICEVNGVRDVGVTGRRFDCDAVTGDSARLNGDDLCAPNDNGLGFLGEVDCCKRCIRDCQTDVGGGLTMDSNPAMAESRVSGICGSML